MVARDQVADVIEVMGALLGGGGVFHPGGQIAGEEVILRGDVMVAAPVEVEFEVLVVAVAFGGFDVEPLAGEGNEGGIEDAEKTVEDLRGDGLRGLVVIELVARGNLEEGERGAEVKVGGGFVDFIGGVVEGLAGVIEELDADVGLAELVYVGMSNVAHESFLIGPALRADGAGGGGRGGGHLLLRQGGQVDGPLGVAIGGRKVGAVAGGQQDVGGAVLAGQREDLRVGEGIEGVAGGEELAAIGGGE